MTHRLGQLEDKVHLVFGPIGIYISNVRGKELCILCFHVAVLEMDRLLQPKLFLDQFIVINKKQNISGCHLKII